MLRARRDGIIAPMELSALGEFGLIDLIKEAAAAEYARNPSSKAHERLRIGIGDDTAYPGPVSVGLIPGM